ncbi:DUF4835 family protein [Fodinibius sp.]|uniref:type IX secretion system protein PorD n=1 Tax=Fodinibius sp. TaxID=1872440 RepID=UPI003567FF02
MKIFFPDKWWCSLFLCALCLLLPPESASQEIRADVTVDRSQVNNTSLSFLDNLADEIETYLNEYSWTDTNFRAEERVRVDIQVTLLSADDNFNFDAQVIFRSRRPIYNTTRETVLFFYNEENWSFTFTPHRTLIHDQLQFDEFTSFLDFYAYLILGYDFDSFNELGGTPYFAQAQNIVSQAQSSPSGGWERSGVNRRNRAQLVADLLNQNYEGLRLAIYQYHRQGLDRFVENPEEARKQILEALEKIQKAKRATSSNFLFDTFFNTKYRELSAIFEDAAPEVRLEAFQLLSNIDQSHLSEYRKLQ